MGYKVSRVTHPGKEFNKAGYRWCSQCLDFLPESRFYKNKARHGGYTSLCKTHHLRLDSLYRRRKVLKKKEEKLNQYIKIALELGTEEIIEPDASDTP